MIAEDNFYWQNMIYTGLLSLILAEYAANHKCSAVLCSAESIYLIVGRINEVTPCVGRAPVLAGMTDRLTVFRYWRECQLGL